MSSIHHAILIRLVLAWLGISLLGGFGVYFYEGKKGDLAIASLVASKTEGYDVSMLISEGEGLGERSYLEQQAVEYVRRNYMIVELLDDDYGQLAKIVNPQYQRYEHQLQNRYLDMPKGLPRYYRKISIAGQTIVESLVRLTTVDDGHARYYYAAFVIDPQTADSIREQLRQSVFIVLLIILLTTVIMYPLIMGLHRSLIKASMKLLHGNLEIAAVLGTAIAKRDTNTSEHNYRVTLYAIALAKALGIKQNDMPGLISGAFLHDVGKIGIPDSILRKPEKLSPGEYEIMKTHVVMGKQIVARSQWLEMASEIIENHHEKYDGTGYVKGLSGTNIPFNARLFAVVDVFDALTADRPYKKSVSVSEALMIIERGSGSHFDPSIVTTFCQMATHLFAKIHPMTEPQLAVALYREAAIYLLNINTVPLVAGNKMTFA